MMTLHKSGKAGPWTFCCVERRELPLRKSTGHMLCSMPTPLPPSLFRDIPRLEVHVHEAFLLYFLWEHSPSSLLGGTNDRQHPRF